MALLARAESKLDRVDFDSHCSHIGVRDLDSGELVTTTRLLDSLAAKRLGTFYSENEFSMRRLVELSRDRSNLRASGLS